MSDLLSKYRREPVAGRTPQKSASPATTDDYVACAMKDKVDRLKIRRANDPTRSPGYAYLLDIVYDGPYGTNFVLVFTFMMVMVRGKNLQTVVAALEKGSADFIQEFDPDKWSEPRDEAAPFIKSIEVVIQDSGAMSQTEKTEKTVH